VRGTRAVAVDRGSCLVLKSGCVVLKSIPCVVLEQWLSVSVTISVRGTRAVVVFVDSGSCVVLNRFCVVMKRGPCVVLEQ
jgi:hypothetical protein